MFFQEDQVNKALICSHCSKKFVDPRILPCGETYCHNCILDLVFIHNSNDQTFKCTSCQSTHQNPSNDDNGSDGFPINKRTAILLAQTPSEVCRDSKSVKALKTCLDSMQNNPIIRTLQNLKTSNAHSLIQEYCSNLKNDVDMQTDLYKHDLDEARQQLFAKIAKYERECCESVERLNGEDVVFCKLVEETSHFVEHWSEKLTQPELSDDEVKVAVEKSTACLKSVAKFIDDRNMPFFTQNRLKFRAIGYFIYFFRRFFNF